MKHFLINYRFKDGTPDDWHEEIRRFIAGLESDKTLNGRIAYRCIKASDPSADYIITWRRPQTKKRPRRCSRARPSIAIAAKRNASPEERSRSCRPR